MRIAEVGLPGQRDRCENSVSDPGTGARLSGEDQSVVSPGRTGRPLAPSLLRMMLAHLGQDLRVNAS